MKAQLFGKPITRGVSTLEILIAFAILTLSITAIIVVIFGNQSLAVDTQTNIEALGKARTLLEKARADAREDYSSVVSTTSVSISGIPYTEVLAVADLTECKKQATSTVSWESQGRSLSIDLTTYLTDVAAALALGGDCGINPPDEGWTKPRLFASYKFNPGQPTAIDVLQRVVYMPDDHNKLNIVDTSGATLNFSGDFITPPFDIGVNVNDIDVAVSTSTGKVYAYIARSDTANQFQIINVTNTSNPVSATTTRLKNSAAQGWRVTFYDGFVYVGTRYLGGQAEFHVFNVSSSTEPREMGNGTSVGTSIYGIVVRDQGNRRLAYMVTTHDDKELVVLDVTNPLSVTPLVGAYTDIPGNKDGRSIYMVGNRIYIGLESGGGEELYVLDASKVLSATSGLPILGKAEIGASSDVTGIRVSGGLAFLVTAKSNDEFQVWSISSSTNITRIDTNPIQLPNKIVSGIDYENPYVYVGSQATNPLQILYSAP